ncbi:TetR/AcrR family transcriptional regulator [Brevibacillus nitrificans]|uniref:TetR/AcrR family transcriptional regulator n=1 Tax=Brevibacillus nitrificans TaxID=651560 RepID=UPI002E1CDDF7|nr:TetR/AcrR family transcriptional regulator [Brevibacillus nitrificans]
MARSKEFDEKEVLRKAMKLFWHQGYEKTSMQDLVEYMGIHRRSMYDTFGDKHSLFMKALEHYCDMMGNKINTIMNQEQTVKQAIRNLFEMTLQRTNEQPVGCLLVNTAVELALHDEEAADTVSKRFFDTERIIYELLLRGQESGEISAHHNPEKLSWFLNNSLVGFRVMVKTTDDKVKLASIIDMTMGVLDS